MIMIMKLDAESAHQCAEFCWQIGPHCDSILWNKKQKLCILDSTSEQDINANGWEGWITCGKMDKQYAML